MEGPAAVETERLLQLSADEHSQGRRQPGSSSGHSERRKPAQSILFPLLLGLAEAFGAGLDAPLRGSTPGTEYTELLLARSAYRLEASLTLPNLVWRPGLAESPALGIYPGISQHVTHRSPPYVLRRYCLDFLRRSRMISRAAYFSAAR